MPTGPRWVLPAVVAAPALAVAAAGLAHPVLLTPDTAERWRAVHLVLLPLLPLLGASVWLLLLGERGPLAWAARGLAAGYALLYSALDSIAGIGAGHQMARTAERGDARPPVEDLYDVGDPLGRLGVALLAASLVCAAVVVVRRTGSRLPLVGAAVGVVGCWAFAQHHVFPPRGVLAVLVVGAGLALVGWAVRPPAAGREPLSVR